MSKGIKLSVVAAKAIYDMDKRANAVKKARTVGKSKPVKKG